MLCLLAAHGVFQEQDGGYGHTASSRLLRADHPMSMRAFSQMMGLPLIWNSVTELEHSVRNGSPSLETFEPKSVWAYSRHTPAKRTSGSSRLEFAPRLIHARLDAHKGRVAGVSMIKLWPVVE
ncbi:MAG: hypothetical protein ACRDRG_08340 [Pseudonocardiaceae bacterium]